MPNEIGRPITIFMSYFGQSSVASDWVVLATDKFGAKFIVHNYQQSPEADPDLLDALKQRIRKSDVFAAILSEEYLDNPTTRAELDAAIEIATGRRGGSLHTSGGRLLVYLLVADDAGRRWCANYQPSFTYFSLSDLDFIRDDKKNMVLAKLPARWDVWIQNMRQRVASLAPLPVMAADGQETKVVMLGCPEASADPRLKADVNAFIAALGSQSGVTWVRDGWFSDRGSAGADGARAVLRGGPKSILVQVCDDRTWEDNLIADSPPGEDLMRKLRRTGLAQAEAEEVLKRTWFWFPSSLVSLRPGLVQEMVAESIASQGPSFGSATPQQLASLACEQLEMGGVRLEAEDGIRDIGPQLNLGLQEYFDRLTFEVVAHESLAKAIQNAALVGSSVLVVIHDRPVAQNIRDKVAAIRNRAAQFDGLIREATNQLGSPPRLARAVFILSHAKEIASRAVITDDTWELIPVDTKRNCHIPADSLQRLQEKLGLPVGPKTVIQVHP